MESKKLQIIKELMEQLQDEMGYDSEDFEERLGRKKPEVKVLKVEGEIDPSEMSDGDDEDMFHSEDEDDAAFLDSREASPDDELKKRLMKLRA